MQSSNEQAFWRPSACRLDATLRPDREFSKTLPNGPNPNTSVSAPPLLSPCTKVLFLHTTVATLSSLS